MDNERPIVKGATEARQGSTRPGLIYVLIGGLLLAAAAGVYIFTVH